MIVTRIEPTDPRQIDDQDFVIVSSEEIDRLAKRLAELLRGMRKRASAESGRVLSGRR